MKILALVAGLWLVLAPLPPRIALNHQTKECAVLYGGDEYISTLPPEGWVEYYPGRGNIVETEVGSCTFSPSGELGAAERCCRELGYRYIDEDIGRTRFTPLMWVILAMYAVAAGGVCLVVGLVLALVVGGVLLVRRRRRRRREALPEAELEAMSDDAEHE
jgi:hypothetical protein